MKLDDLISAAITATVTVLFVAVTVANWPTPFQLHKFRIERDNPIASFIRQMPDLRIAAND